MRVFITRLAFAFIIGSRKFWACKYIAMSSHHFVREGQEPALLIIDPVAFAIAEPLLEWAPLVVVTVDALDNTLSWDIKIDGVITSETGDKLTEQLMDQAPVKIITVDAQSIFESALFFLIASKQKAVSILTTNALKTIENSHDFTDKLTINVLCGSERWLSITGGVFKKWFSAGSTLQVHGQSGEPSLMNLQQSGNSFLVLEDGLVEIRYLTPFWVRETV
jgi:hypothetical protein